MEAFESFVALALEAEDLVIMGPAKFKITRQTKKKSVEEFQTHGYEIDLVAARADKLVLVSVKSFFGSQGVRPEDVIGKSAKASSYMMLNDVKLRSELVKQAAEKFGYKESQVEMRLYGGKFKYGEKGLAEVRDWASKQKVGAGPIAVVTGDEVAAIVVQLAKSKTYRDHEVLMTVKVLLQAGMINESFSKQEPEVKTSKMPSAKNDTHIPLTQVIKTLPVGSTVKSSKDGLVGVVLGHKQDAGKAAYVRLWVDGEEKSYLRSASSLNQIKRSN